MSVVNDARALVARSRAAQGLPERITDPAILARVAAILAGPRNGNAGPHKAGATTTTTAASGRRGSRGPE